MVLDGEPHGAAFPAALPPDVESSEPLSADQGVMEVLVERSLMPVSLPGLHLKLVAPEAGEAAGGESAADEQRARNETPAAPAPAPPAPVDIEAVADRVYQTLARRQQLERERQGLY